MSSSYSTTTGPTVYIYITYLLLRALNPEVININNWDLENHSFVNSRICCSFQGKILKQSS